MNRVVIAVATLLMIGVGLYFGGMFDIPEKDLSYLNSYREEKRAQKEPAFDIEQVEVKENPFRQAVTFEQPSITEVDALRDELRETSKKLTRISRPLYEDVISSAVRAEIQESESLVQGGYRTSEGNYEIAFLTPKNVVTEDGAEAIELETKMLSVGSEFVGDNGLDTLATNVRNTLQHAEAWAGEEVSRVVASAANSVGNELVAMPKVLVNSGQEFSFSMGEPDFPTFSLEGSINRKDGAFLIESRLVRVEQNQVPAPTGE